MRIAKFMLVASLLSTIFVGLALVSVVIPYAEQARLSSAITPGVIHN